MTEAKGIHDVMVIGCNSAAYPVSMDAWRQLFPNALIVGMRNRINGGEKWIRPFLLDKVCGDAFFRNPPSTDLDMAKACYDINRAMLVQPGIVELRRPARFSHYFSNLKVARTFDNQNQPLETFPRAP